MPLQLPVGTLRTKNCCPEVATEHKCADAIIESINYCYVPPQSFYKDDFDINTESYGSYSHRRGMSRRLFKATFTSEALSRRRNISKKLNYRMK